MRPVAIVTDTTHYLPAEVVADNDLHQVSLYVNWGDHQEREIEMPDFEGFYDRLRDTAALPTTSQPSIGDFLAVYEPLLDSGHDVLSIHIAGGLSGTCEAARQTVAQLGDRAEGRIEVLDSETGCGGMGLVLLGAAAAARAGADLAGVTARAGAVRDRVRIWFCVDTLEYLRRGGRIGKAQAWVGGALKLKPILTLEAEVTPVERVRTASRAFERMVDYLCRLRDDGSDAWVVQHARAPAQAEALVERGREVFGSEPRFVSEIGPVLGTHVGPGLLGAGGAPADLVDARA